MIEIAYLFLFAFALYAALDSYLTDDLREISSRETVCGRVAKTVRNRR